MRSPAKGFLVIMVLFFQVFASAETLLSYREWKNEKLQTAVSNMQTLKKRLDRAKTQAVVSEIKRIEQDLSQEKWNLEISQELSVSDYFAIYLIHKNRTQYQNLAKKMTPAEVAELISAYAESMTPTETPNPKSLQLPTLAAEGPKEP